MVAKNPKYALALGDVMKTAQEWGDAVWNTYASSTTKPTVVDEWQIVPLSNRSKGSTTSTYIQIQALAYAFGGTITFKHWSPTATVTIGNTTAKYRPGVNGSYVNSDDGMLYVSTDLFAKDFDIRGFEVSYEAPVTAFSGSIIQQHKVNNSTYITSYRGDGVIIDNTLEGQKLAESMNQKMNDDIETLTWIYSTLLGLVTWGVGSEIPAIVKGIITGIDAAGNAYQALAHPDYSYGLEAGDALLTTTTITAKAWSMSRVYPKTVANVYNKDWELKGQYNQ